ncbi:MAG: ExbD/TolR family protein [Planctomycetaceae bacterium]
MSRRRSGFGNDDPLIPRKKRTDETDIDITPMIDVTFLLLIFFMVSSTMEATPNLELPATKHGEQVASLGATFVTILGPEGAGEPTILLGDGKGPEASVDEVGPYVREGLRAGRLQVIIKADRDVRHGFVQQVARAVQDEIEEENNPDAYFVIGVDDKLEK